jgi:hypothetical protein
LNFRRTTKFKTVPKVRKTRRFNQESAGFLVRPEGFEPPAFWSVACLRDGDNIFRPCLALFAQPIGPFIYHPLRLFRRRISCSGSSYGSNPKYGFLMRTSNGPSAPAPDALTPAPPQSTPGQSIPHCGAPPPLWDHPPYSQITPASRRYRCYRLRSNTSRKSENNKFLSLVLLRIANNSFSYWLIVFSVLHCSA